MANYCRLVDPDGGISLVREQHVQAYVDAGFRIPTKKDLDGVELTPPQREDIEIVEAKGGK